MFDELDEPTLRRLKSIFFRVAEQPDPASQQRLLNEVCGEDAVLRARIERLLRADAGEFASGLDAGIFQSPWRPEEGGKPAETKTSALSTGRSSAVSGVATIPADQLELPPRIGPYKPLEVIGEGGMGVVYLAEQHQPVRRRVALKVIKPGMDSRQVIARFEAERQALAMMDHPHIAHALDAGQTDSGLPYFVMELVRGVPITKFCQQNSLSLEERLRLFQDVCSAVQHAHVKGVIHRDLKPSNLLVTMHDDRPIVKVIDFGVAKAVGQPLTERTLYTGLNQVVGTLLYMSPEQAQHIGIDVDTRSDVYSLGVVLYELLTGTLPFDRQQLEKSGIEGFRKLLIDVDPPCPSKRLSSVRVEVPSPSDVEPDPVPIQNFSPGAIRGELDWIVMKALEKDRQRRYQSAAALGADIDRYLQHEPIDAGPASIRYRVGKWLRRNRGVALTTAATVLVLLGAVVFLLVSNAQIQAEQQRTQIAKDEATAGLEEAQKQLHRADANLRLTLEALDAIFSDEITATSIHTSGQAEPRTEAELDRLRYCLRFYEQLTLSNKSNADLQLESAKASMRYGFINLGMQKPQFAEAPFRNALWTLERLVAESPDDRQRRLLLARCQHGLIEVWTSKHAAGAKTAEPLARQSAATRRQLYETFDLERDPYNERADFARILGKHSAILRNLGQYDEAEAVARESLEVLDRLATDYPDEPIYRQEIALGHRLLGEVFQAANDTPQAIQYHRQALTIYQELAEAFPADPGYRRELADTQRQMASILLASDVQEGAVERLLTAARLYQGLIADRAEDRISDWYDFRSTYRQLLAEVVKGPEFHDSTAALQQLIQALAPLAAIHPEPDKARNILIELNLMSADHCQRAKLTSAALPFCEQTDEVLDQLSIGPQDDFKTCGQAIQLYRMWSELLEGQGNQEEAKRQSARAAEAERVLAGFDRSKAQVAFQKGLVQLENGDLDAAIALLQESFRLYPRDRDVNVTLANALSLKGDLAAARLHLISREFSIGLLDVEYHTIRANTFVETGETELAKPILRSAMRNTPDHPPAYLTLALINLTEDDLPGYRQTCARMQEQLGDAPETRGLLLWACALGPTAVEDYAPLLRLAEASAEDKARSPTKQLAGAAILYRAGQTEAAIEKLTEFAPAEIADPEISPAFAAFFLAMAHHQAQQPEEAQRWLKKGLDLAAAEQGKPSTSPRRVTLKILQKEAQSLLETATEETNSPD